MSVLRHSAWAGAAAIVLAGSRFLYSGIIARRLSVVDFGQYSYAQWLSDMAFLIGSLGAVGALSRYIAEYRHDPELLAAFVKRWRPIALGVPMWAAVMVLVGARVSDLSLDSLALVMLPVWTLSNGMWAMQTAALTGLQRFDLIFIANAVAASVFVGGALLLPLDAQPVGRLFALTALAAAGAATVGYSATRTLPHKSSSPLDSQRWRTMRLYALNVWFTALLWSLVWSRGEMPIVRRFLGDGGVAHYAASLTLFGGAVQAVNLAISGVAPQLTRLWGEGSHDKALLLARRVMDAQLLLCGLACVFIISFSPELMHLAFGDAYAAQSGALAALSLGLLGMAVSCQNHVLQIATDARFSRDSTLLGLFVLFGSAALLIAVAGIPGAASARAGTMLIMAAVSLLAMHRRWGNAGYSMANVTRVVFLAVSCAVAQLWLKRLSWPVRVAPASLALTLMLMAVRDVNGQLQARTILDALRRVLIPASTVVRKVE